MTTTAATNAPTATPAAAATGEKNTAKVTWATGRRKTAIARVRVRAGTGVIMINERPYDAYFAIESARKALMQPMVAADVVGKVDVHVNVIGGGSTSQAGAVMMGIARALQTINPEVRGTLKEQGLLARDSRKVERKKYGKRGARRGTQFSKR